MKYIVNKSNNPAYNVALEAYAFRELLDEDEIFILWINEPAIIIGKHQNAIQEINKEYTDKHNIHVVRRLSGGGAVYHDLNNLNYTIISNKADEGAFDFKTFSQPVIATLADLGVKAEFTGRNDLEIDGKKFCGNAQAYYKGRMMHHGCLMFNVDTSVLADALKVSKDKIESKGIKSVRARVTNILDELPEDHKISVNEFSDLLLQKMIDTHPDMTEYVLSEDELSHIQKSADEQFGTWEWTYGKSPEYTIERNVRYPAGKITTFANVENSIIKGIKIYGDFFGIGDVFDIENLLIGQRYEYTDVLAKLQTIDTTHYFSRMTTEEIAKAIVA
ncbi:lipoate--protein ligase [Streptococcus dentiloxodontae]